MPESAFTFFKRLKIANWRQFLSVDIEFHEHLTVITGVNGAGKSTLLNILTQQLGGTRPFLGVPNKSDGKSRFLNNVLRIGGKVISWFGNSKPEHPNVDYIGELEYSSSHVSKLSIPKEVGLQYSIAIESQQPVVGFHMPSHRQMPTYQAVQNISFQGTDPQTAFHQLIANNYSAYLGHNTNTSVMFVLKQILTNWAAIGEGNKTFDADPRQYSAYTGFINVLKRILPSELGFTGLRISPPEILIETQSGTFLIDSASGGLSTLIEIAALIYTFTLRSDVQGQRFVVTFDEPENHLHPSLQRSLLPTLVETFPQVQFIVATHSPFMVSSLRDSLVYALRHRDYNVEGASELSYRPAVRWVESHRLDHANRAGPASEILRDVLGVPVTLPVWVQRELELIVAKYESRALDESMLADLRQDVDRSGLSDLFSEAVSLLGRDR